MSDPHRAPEDWNVLQLFTNANASRRRRLLEMSQKTAEEEERYRSEMEKYAVAFLGFKYLLSGVCNTSCLCEGSRP